MQRRSAAKHHLARRQFIELLGVGTCAIFSPLLTGCGSRGPFRLGIHPWVGYETLYLAKYFGWLPPEVQFHEGVKAGDSLAALKAGLVDVACLTLDEMLRARAEGIPMTAVLVFDVSAGGDMVVAKPPISTPRDLKGHRIGYEQNALGAVVLNKVLEAGQLSEADVTAINLPLDQQLSAWNAGEVDAVITYDPTASRLRHSGARQIFDSRSIPDTIFDVLAVKISALERFEESLSQMISAHFRGLQHLLVNRSDAIYRIAAHQQVSPEDVQMALAGVVLPGELANRTYLAPGSTRLMDAARGLSDLMVERQLIEKKDTLSNLFSDKWLPNASF